LMNLEKYSYLNPDFVASSKLSSRGYSERPKS
jgi:hypothetical protein